MTGSKALSAQICGLSEAKSLRVGKCQDQRRLLASFASGAIDSGRTVRTVNLRIAFTFSKVAEIAGGWNWFE